MIHLGQKRNAGRSRHHFLEQRKPLPGDVVSDHRHAGDVATRSAQTIDEAAPHRVH